MRYGRKAKTTYQINYEFKIRENVFRNECLLVAVMQRNLAGIVYCHRTIKHDNGDAKIIKKTLPAGFYLDLSDIIQK